MSNFAFLLIIPILKFLINLSHWNFIRRVINHHNDWLAGLSDSSDENTKKTSKKAAEWIQAHTDEITRVYLRTGRKKPIESFMEPIGYGSVQEQRLNVLDNLLYQNEQILRRARDCLFIAKGYFLTQTKQSLNPIYWLEILFYLPSSLVSASGIETTSKFAEAGIKIAQLIYWALIVLLVLTRPDIIESLL